MQSETVKKSRLFWKNRLFLKLFYEVKPFIPRGIQLWMRRYFFRKNLDVYSTVWPIDPGASNPPPGWQGWPEGKRFALVLTHDVESETGLMQCQALAELEMELGFRSSFNFLLNKYTTPESLRTFLESNGFEVGIHGCYHDGKMFRSRGVFKERATIINRYLVEWGVGGFRSPSMHSRLDWIRDLNIEYDMSTFDTDPFEPHGDGVGTIFPFWVPRSQGCPDYLEIPYTLPQDFTLFILLEERNVDIWKKKLDWIAMHGGMAVLVVHPDYICFDGRPCGKEQYDVRYYREILDYLKEKYPDMFWSALPKDVAHFFRDSRDRGESDAA